MPAVHVQPRNRIGVVLGRTNLRHRNPAVPDRSRLVAQVVELKCERWVEVISVREKQQGDALRAGRVNREVYSVFTLQPRHAEWRRSSFARVPVGPCWGCAHAWGLARRPVQPRGMPLASVPETMTNRREIAHSFGTATASGSLDTRATRPARAS